MNIEVKSWSGHRLACFVDGRRVFHMHKRDHKRFYERVELLRKQDRVDQWLAQQRQIQMAVMPVGTLQQNVVAAIIARLEGSIERDRQIDEKLMPWIKQGMPVPISSVPLFGGLANE